MEEIEFNFKGKKIKYSKDGRFTLPKNMTMEEHSDFIKYIVKLTKEKTQKPKCEQECKHKDGWILKEEIVIHTDWENDNLEGIFECNTLGCGKRKRMRFDIINIEDTKLI